MRRLKASRGQLFRALRHHDYRLLFTAFTINQIGFWVSHISLQGLMADLSHNDPFRLGLLFFALFSPAFFLGPVFGVFADRYDRRRMMLGAYAAIASLMLALAVLTAVELMTPNRLLGLAVVLGVTFTFSAPAAAALAANAVQREDLASAVSVSSAANNLTRVFGPALAAPLIAARQFAVSFAIFGTAALVAAMFVARMRVAARPQGQDVGSVLARVRLGVAHARERRPAMAALFTVAVLALFGVAHVALLPVFADRVMHRPELFAWFVAAAGVGALAGSVSTAWQVRPTLRAAALQLLVYGVALAAFALSPSAGLALAAQVVVGFCYFAIMTGLQTLLQQVVDDEKRGRIMSLFHVAWGGLVPFGALAMGAVADPLGVVPTFLIAAGICTLSGILVATSAAAR